MKKLILIPFLLFCVVCYNGFSQKKSPLEFKTKIKPDKKEQTARINVKVLNGQADYSYYLYKNFIQNKQQASKLSVSKKKYTFSDVPEGTYMIVVTDGNKMEGAKTISISFNDEPDCKN